MTSTLDLDALERLHKEAPEGPYYVGDDDAEDCPPHRKSGLAMVDTGRVSDWPIARLCEWNTARLIAFGLPALPELIEAARERDRLRERVAELETQLNTPELHDFAGGVVSEAQHQRARWGVENDAGKTPADWFWLLGYLAGKALAAANAGNAEKALHHCISSAAALANWHAHLSGASTAMRPGIEPPVSLSQQGKEGKRK